jgi:hypothetical protein
VALPVTKEMDGTSKELYPHESRLRNMTYACSIYMQITAKQYEINSKNEMIHPNQPTFVFPPLDVCMTQSFLFCLTQLNFHAIIGRCFSTRNDWFASSYASNKILYVTQDVRP